MRVVLDFWLGWFTGLTEKASQGGRVAIFYAFFTLSALEFAAILRFFNAGRGSCKPSNQHYIEEPTMTTRNENTAIDQTYISLATLNSRLNQARNIRTAYLKDNLADAKRAKSRIRKLLPAFVQPRTA